MIKKISIITLSLGLSLLSLSVIHKPVINAEGLTSGQQIRAKIAQQSPTINLAVAQLLILDPSEAEKTLSLFSSSGLDSDRVLADGHGFLSSSMASLTKDPVAAQEFDTKGNLVRSYNLMTDPDVTTFGEIKSAYYTAIHNNYQQYYPSAHTE